jgi:carbonic anhydrase
MHNDQHHQFCCGGVGRRGFLKGLATVSGLGVLGVNFVSEASAAALTKAQRDGMSPDQILQKLKTGNSRFRGDARKSRNYLKQQRATASGQYPAAVLLSCIDSRAPAEVIMDLGLGDIFNCRVAGNISNPDILGSMEFAAKVSGAKVVLVMGHTACGAIKGAIDNAELGNLTELLAKIKPAVQATEYSGERSSKNYAFVDAVARTNVRMTLESIRRDSSVLADLEKSGAIKIAGAMYNLNTGGVDFLN